MHRFPLLLGAVIAVILDWPYILGDNLAAMAEGEMGARGKTKGSLADLAAANPAAFADAPWFE